MFLDKWMDVVDKDFPKIENVSREMVEAATRQALLMRGNVRLMTGRLSTTSELEQRRKCAMQPLI